MPVGVVTLGQVAARLDYLDVGCSRCDRTGRLRLDRLTAEHGPDMPMPTLGRLLAADCPRLIADRMHDVCGWRFPQLSRLTL